MLTKHLSQALLVPRADAIAHFRNAGYDGSTTMITEEMCGPRFRLVGPAAPQEDLLQVIISHKVVSQKSIPTQICQLRNNKG